MTEDTFSDLWTGAYETTHKHYDNSKLHEPTNLLFKMLDAVYHNPKLQSLIINSFLNFFTEKNISHEDLTKELKGHTQQIITNLLLNKDYHLTNKDDALFLYGQYLHSTSSKLTQQEQNLENPNYHELVKKYSLEVKEKPTFDDVFTTAMQLFPQNSTSTFDSINSYIEKNKDIWDEQTNKTKSKKLLQKHNDQILKKLSDWEIRKIVTEHSNTPSLKHFLKISKMTMDGGHKHSNLMPFFFPWFITNIEQNTWDDFTNDYNSKPEETRSKIACKLIFENKKNKRINIKQLIMSYTAHFTDIVIENAPNDRILWLSNVFLMDAIKYLKTTENQNKYEGNGFGLKQITITEIPTNVTQNNLTFATWLQQENFLPNNISKKMNSILMAYNLEEKINTTNTTAKKHKI